MEYQTQQYKLFPAIATVFALNFSASWLWDVYNSVSSELEHGDLEKLPEVCDLNFLYFHLKFYDGYFFSQLHAMSCCLKAVSSKDATSMVEICRLSCGGHGYMTSSSFPNVYGTATAAITYEGENTVLLLQTARLINNLLYFQW